MSSAGQQHGVSGKVDDAGIALTGVRGWHGEAARACSDGSTASTKVNLRHREVILKVQQAHKRQLEEEQVNSRHREVVGEDAGIALKSAGARNRAVHPVKIEN